MSINLFHKCFYMWLNDNSSCLAKILLISDKQHNDTISESTFEENTEWRDENGEPIDRPAECTWESIISYQEQAESVPDYAN